MKHLSIRIGGLLAFVLLFCFSCTDHEPGRQPRVITGEAVATPTAPAVSFKVIVEAGDFPIVEYGVVYSLKENANDNVFNTTPTVADTKAVFPLPATNGQHIKVENVVPFVEMYYRAYAIIQGGAVIYGDVMVIDKNGNEQIIAPKIKTLNINAYPFPGQVQQGMVMLGLSIEDLGSTPITEFGIVWRIFNTDTQQTFPTIEDNKTVLPLPAAVGNHWQLKAGVLNGEIHYRAYAILQSGGVVYADNALNFD